MHESPPQDGPLPGAIDLAQGHLQDILRFALEHGPGEKALVVWDSNCQLAKTLTEAYRRCLPKAKFIEFEAHTREQILQEFAQLLSADLVVLVQSTSFRLDRFRIRIELFRRGLKVIEHPHLQRMRGPERSIYIDALAYDPSYYRGVGASLKRRIDRAQETIIESAGERLMFPGPLETAKLNVGDYTLLKNVGGQYPIGEVFTESKDLEAVNGRVRISFFGDTNYRVNRPPEPITLVIEEGRVQQALQSTPEFDRVLNTIREGEGQVWLRELGFGLNRAMGQDRTVQDIGTFERMCGVHLSLGAKHVSYNKPNIRKKDARYHVDVFALSDSVTIDGVNVYLDGAWCDPLDSKHQDPLA